MFIVFVSFVANVAQLNIHLLRLSPNSPWQIRPCALTFSTNLKKNEATTEYRATLVHLIYMCQNLLSNEANNNGYYCYSMACK